MQIFFFFSFCLTELCNSFLLFLRFSFKLSSCFFISSKYFSIFDLLECLGIKKKRAKKEKKKKKKSKEIFPYNFTFAPWVLSKSNPFNAAISLLMNWSELNSMTFGDSFEIFVMTVSADIAGFLIFISLFVCFYFFKLLFCSRFLGFFDSASLESDPSFLFFSEDGAAAAAEVDEEEEAAGFFLTVKMLTGVELEGFAEELEPTEEPVWKDDSVDDEEAEEEEEEEEEIAAAPGAKEA